MFRQRWGVSQFFSFLNPSNQPGWSVMTYTMRTILLIILILILVGSLPTWGYAPVGWGYYPGGGLLVVIVLILLLWRA